MNNRVKEFWDEFCEETQKKGFNIEMLSNLGLLLIG